MQTGCVPVPRISGRGFWLVPSSGAHALNHRHQLLAVGDLLGQLSGDNHLGTCIHSRLRVVSLDKAFSSVIFHHPGVGVGKVVLPRGFAGVPTNFPTPVPKLPDPRVGPGLVANRCLASLPLWPREEIEGRSPPLQRFGNSQVRDLRLSLTCTYHGCPRLPGGNQFKDSGVDQSVLLAFKVSCAVPLPERPPDILRTRFRLHSRQLAAHSSLFAVAMPAG